MRNIYTYRLIRYFPHIRSDEFFNVGLWLRDKDLQERRVYIDEKQGHLEILSKFPSVNQQVLAFFLERLKQETDASAWYDNHLRFSEADSMASEQTIDEVANLLYDDYIGYKFHNHENRKNKEETTCVKISFETILQVNEKPQPHNFSYLSEKSCQDYAK